MQKKIIFSLILICIAMILIAGCSSSKSADSTPATLPVTSVKVTRTTAIPTVAANLATSPSQFSGSGDDVVSFTASGAGLRVFSMLHSGKSNFAIWLQDSGGEKIDLIVNEIGTYSGKKSERLTTGKYYLDVTASGPWTVDISSP